MIRCGRKQDKTSGQGAKAPAKATDGLWGVTGSLFMWFGLEV